MQVYEDVAIVGMACRYPGDINDLTSMWDVLINKRNVVSNVSTNRWDTDAIMSRYSKQISPLMLDRIRYGGFLSESQLDEASSYYDEILLSEGVSTKINESLESFQKILSVVTFEALCDELSRREKIDVSAKGESFGMNYVKNAYRRSPSRTIETEADCKANVGVFVGCPGLLNQSTAEYYCGQNKSLPVFEPGASTGSCSSILSNLFEFSGPSIAIDTACSSSLVALHIAVRSLQQKECDVAVSAAMHMVRLEMSISCAVAGMLSPDGKCHTFDESANGYVRSEGCGAVVLKRISDAKRDKNEIYGIIRGSAIMQDGKSASLTAPNGKAQEELINSAFADTNCNGMPNSALKP
jgi:acyl transferase domain-containing protein